MPSMNSPTIEGNRVLKTFNRYAYILPALATVLCMMLAADHLSKVDQVHSGIYSV
jgi:hypothetical protein